MTRLLTQVAIWSLEWFEKKNNTCAPRNYGSKWSWVIVCPYNYTNRRLWSALDSHWLASFHHTFQTQWKMMGSPTDIGAIVHIQNKGPLIGALSFGPTLSSWGSVWGTSRSQGKKCPGSSDSFLSSGTNHQAQHLLPWEWDKAGHGWNPEVTSLVWHRVL